MMDLLEIAGQTPPFVPSVVSTLNPLDRNCQLTQRSGTTICLSPWIDRNRYWAYAGGISSLLVLTSRCSSSIPTITTSSQPTSATAPSETYFPSWWPISLPTPILPITNKFWKLTFLMSIVTWGLKSLSSRTNICSNIQVMCVICRR